MILKRCLNTVIGKSLKEIHKEIGFCLFLHHAFSIILINNAPQNSRVLLGDNVKYMGN